MSIKIENLSYTYAQGSAYEIHALKNLSLEIHDGEFIGIIGHTGSGKSTLIQLLDGLIKADEGHIYYDGEDIYAPGYSLRSLRGRVGLVFQYPEYQLFETTVLKDAAYGPQNQGFSEKEALEKAREALVRVKLSEKYWEMSPFELSGGQKRRAAIAGVIAMNPKVLILDEPTAGLDPKGRDELFDLIRELHEKMDGTGRDPGADQGAAGNRYHDHSGITQYGRYGKLCTADRSFKSWNIDVGRNTFRSIFPCARAGTGVIGGPAGDLSDERSGKSRISCGYDSDNDRGSKERDY